VYGLFEALFQAYLRRNTRLCHANKSAGAAAHIRMSREPLLAASPDYLSTITRPSKSIKPNASSR
jgi:hypothetical protein